MMELSLKQEAIEWIDSVRGKMSRQAFVRSLVYNNLHATSGEENNEGRKEATNTDEDSGLRL